MGLVCSALLAVGLHLCQTEASPALNGYIETEPLRLAAASSGRITQMNVNTGDSVTAGQVLFALDAENEQAALKVAQARLHQAQAQADDLATGKRPAEVASLQANLNAANATLKQAETELARQQTLVNQGYLPKANVDTYRAQRDTAAANVKAAQAQIQTAQLAGREQTRVAANANSQALQDAITQAEWALAQKSVIAPHNASVEKRYYQQGEWVGAGSPVLSLLSPDQYKIRFFLPETELGKVKVGNSIQFQCDGCQQTQHATIRFIANTAEYTPPVLYTKEQWPKLVYMVEATPSDTSQLHAGQPISLWLATTP
jgi:HlyD family secretion protein